MECKHCGKNLDIDAKFCEWCGAPVSEADEVANNSSMASLFFAKAGDLNANVSKNGASTSDFGLIMRFGKKNKGEKSAAKRTLPPPHMKKHRYADTFNRSPRLKYEPHKETIKIQKPPTIGAKPEINWLTVLLPPIAMATIFILMSVLSKGSSTYLFFMIPMQLISVGISIITYRQQTKKHVKTEEIRESKYHAYLEKTCCYLEEENARQRKILLQMNPSPRECISAVENQTKHLWERRPTDSDFGTFRIGIGSVQANVRAIWEEDELALEEDVLEKEAAAMANAFKTIDDVPITIPSDGRIVGITGEENDSIRLAKSIVVQLTALHSYEDMKIVIVFPEPKKEQWKWVRWLPHLSGKESDMRLLAFTQSGASTLKEKLTDVLRQRKNISSAEYRNSSKKNPQYVVFLTTPELYWDNEFFTEVAADDLGIRLICLAQSVSFLPKECDHIVELKHHTGKLYCQENAGDTIRFVTDSIREEELEKLSRTMASITLSSAEITHTIPNSISFLKGYGLKQIDDYDLRRAWRNADVSKSLAVPIGVDESGNQFVFDICDGKHGVHGLIGGMPGSGKSEMLQSWLLSLAMNFSPQDVSFVLIDFKGTGLITPFVGLPHLAGTISNIDTDIKRNKESLEYELERRERLFDEAGVSNIRDYLQLVREGTVKERLPILIVVIDEFAEFKKAFPEFMKWVESSFTKGRSEGVWFVLATQQPGSQASEAIKSNTHFKWCLKVASPSASKEMVGIPDAAQITRPGRAFIRVSNSNADFLTQVQSFWSGAPYHIGNQTDADSQKIAVVDINGNRHYFSDSANLTGYKSGRTEIDAAVAYIAAYAKKNRIPNAKKVWEEKLLKRLPLSAICKEGFDGTNWPTSVQSGFSVPVGEVDDPQHQQKYPLNVNFSDLGHIEVLGAPATGKTTFLKTLITAAALRYRPEDLNVYIMDFGSLSMRVFSAMPQVGGIAEMGQDEKIAKLAELLREELEHRKRLFAEEGVSTIEEYRKSTGKKLPYILLAVDNFNVALPTYPELDALFLPLLQNGAGYGMFLAAAATGANGVNYKYQPSIKMAYALQLTDKSEYSGVVGKTNGLVPEPFMGRGLMRGNPPLQFQTALPADGNTDAEITQNLKQLAEQMSKAWHKPRAKRIPELPEMIPYGSIESDGVCLGLTCSKVEPVIYRKEDQHCLMISGCPRSGKSNLLRVLAKQFAEQLSATVYCLDATGLGKTGFSEICDVYLSDAGQIDRLFDELMPVIKTRQENRDSSKEIGEPILIVIDDYSEFFRAVSEKTVRRLLAINKLAAGLGVYVAIACGASELSVMRSKGEELTSALLLNKQAVLLGGCVNDHSAFQLKIPYAKKSVEVKDTEGFFVDGSRVVRFKAMRSEETV